MVDDFPPLPWLTSPAVFDAPQRIVEDRVKERFMRFKSFNRPKTNGEARSTTTPRPVVTRQASRSMTTSGDLTEEVNQQEPLPVVVMKKLTADEDGTPYEHSHGAPVYITQTSFESSTNSLDLVLPSANVSRIPRLFFF